jgi:chemotaxis signal transduction protein
VLDAAVLLGVERDSAARRLLLVLGHGEAACGLAIDGVPERLRFDAATQLEAAATPPALEACVRAVYCINEVDWFDLEPAALFGRLESSLAA